MRVLSLLFPLWLAVVGVEPSLVHSCPMHDGGVAAHVVPAGDASDAGHQHHAVADTDQAPAQHSAGCTCLGDCAPAAGVALASGIEVPASVVVASARVDLPPVARSVASASQLRLPFANGPPVDADITRA